MNLSRLSKESDLLVGAEKCCIFSISLLWWVHCSVLLSAGEAALEPATPTDWTNWSGRLAQGLAVNWTLWKLWCTVGCWTNLFILEITDHSLHQLLEGQAAPSLWFRSTATKTVNRKSFLPSAITMYNTSIWPRLSAPHAGICFFVVYFQFAHFMLHILL